jgi:hypothetical protein
MNAIKLQNELAFEDGETIQQQFSHSLGSSLEKLHISESLNNFLRVKAIDLSQDKLTLELTNVSSSKVMEKGANIVKLFAYAKPFALHMITALEKTSVDPIKFLKLDVGSQNQENEANPADATNQVDTISTAISKADYVFSRSISLNMHKVQSKKIPIEADAEIVLFPKQSKTIEIDFKELRALPKATVGIEKVPEDKSFICKLGNQDELFFGKLSFVIVSQTKGKLNLPAGHCFGYLNLDPRILNVNDIQIRIRSNSEERVGDSSGQNTLESEDVEMMDVSDLNNSAISDENNLERQIIVQEAVEVQKSQNELTPQSGLLLTNDASQDKTDQTEDEFNLSLSSDKATVVEDNVCHVEHETSVNIITDPVKTKFVFSSCVPGFNGLIEAARSYTISTGKVIEDVIVECIVHAMNSLSTFDSLFSSFNSIAQFFKNNTQKERKHIIQILDKKSMNLFSKIMSQDLMDSFLLIMYHILPDFVSSSSGKDNPTLEDLSVTDIPGKGSVQLNSSFSLEDMCDALTEVDQSPAALKKKKNQKPRKKPQMIAPPKLMPLSTTIMNSIAVPAQLLADPIATSDTFEANRNTPKEIFSTISKDTDVEKLVSTPSLKNIVSSNLSKLSGTQPVASSSKILGKDSAQSTVIKPASSSGGKPGTSSSTLAATTSGTISGISTGISITDATATITTPKTALRTLPGTSSGTTLSTSSGLKTVPSSGSTPATSSGSTPAKPKGTTSGTSSGTTTGIIADATTGTIAGAKPGTSSCITPAALSGKKTLTSSGSTPATSLGSLTATSLGTKPLTSSGAKLVTSSGTKPVTSSGSTPATVSRTTSLTSLSTTSSSTSGSTASKQSVTTPATAKASNTNVTPKPQVAPSNSQVAPSTSASGQSTEGKPVLPDPARYFVNLHVGIVINLDQIYYVKTDKGKIIITMKEAMKIGLGEKVLIQNDKNNAMKWIFKLSNWNSLEHCYIGKVVEENPVNKMITVKYNGKTQASLNSMRVKNFGSSKEMIKIGTNLMIYVAPNQEKAVVSLAIPIEKEDLKNILVVTGDATVVHFVENIGILDSNLVKKGSTVAFHRNALFNLKAEDLMNTEVTIIYLLTLRT